MNLNIVGQPVNRVDAVAKVTGQAKYTGDFFERGMLVGKVLRSPYAHAIVKSIDAEKAKALPGVEAVLTAADVPRHLYATAGHPMAMPPKIGDKEDRRIITDKARFVGDVVAAVVAEDELTALSALKLIIVEYEILPAVFTPEAALADGAPLIHQESPRNMISDAGFQFGDQAKAWQEAELIFENEYETPIVQHCQMENHVSYAYLDSDQRIVIVTSTQIPHIVRRIVGQALGIPWGRIRVIKPYIGGGFGSKQDVCLEALNAAMTLAVGGRPVKIDYSREECMIDTRTRHAFKSKMKTGISKAGKLIAQEIDLLSNNGAYASHGHSIAMASGSKCHYVYGLDAFKYSPVTVYTNLPVAGAMRGYGSPQLAFFLESQMDDIARKMDWDPLDFRLWNLMPLGYVDPHTGTEVLSSGIKECLEQGRLLLDWDHKRQLYQNQKGKKRKGVGMACFSYGSGTYPSNLELAAARILLNEDGSIQLQVGATEIGQGSDTIFAQMAAEIIGLPMDAVHVVSTQDTDISPVDSGAYASRQAYVSGRAVKETAIEVKMKILQLAARISKKDVAEIDLQNGQIVNRESGENVITLAQLALRSHYDPQLAAPISSEVSHVTRHNAISFGATFVEVEVDMATGRVDILRIINLHDSGKIINPQLAEGQVHGGVSMAIGYALSEELLFDPQTGQPLNNNLLDYKLPTIMDTPEIETVFVETAEPSGPFENKSLGEPPTISPAPAIRNALLHATGVSFDRLPITPQRVFEKLKSAGLI